MLLFISEISNGSADLPTREEPEHPLCPVCGGIVENNHACFKMEEFREVSLLEKRNEKIL